jgi:hypothetical protein
MNTQTALQVAATVADISARIPEEGAMALTEASLVHLSEVVPAQLTELVRLRDANATLVARLQTEWRRGEQPWIRCEDGMPKDGVMVLVAYTDSGKPHVGIAEHAGPRTLPLHEDACGEGQGEYDDESGDEWCKPGWYSQNAVNEVEWKLENVYAWMSLPKPPVPEVAR